MMTVQCHSNIIEVSFGLPHPFYLFIWRSNMLVNLFKIVMNLTTVVRVLSGAVIIKAVRIMVTGK